MNPEDFDITNYTWVDGKLNCHQSVILKHRCLTQLPFEFGVVDGDFYCSYNKLTSLEGLAKDFDLYKLECDNKEELVEAWREMLMQPEFNF